MIMTEDVRSQSSETLPEKAKRAESGQERCTHHAGVAFYVSARLKQLIPWAIFWSRIGY